MVSFNILSIVTLAITIAGVSAGNATDAQRHAPSSIPNVWKLLGDAVSHTDPLDITISLVGQDMPGLAARMQAIADEGEGNWLTTDELATYAGASEEARTQVKNHLISQGVNANNIVFSDLGDEVRVSSNVGLVSKLFSATFQKYSLSGSPAVARTKQYTIPENIAHFVENVSPISSFQKVDQYGSIEILSDQASKMFDRRARTTGCTVAGVTPECLRNLYNTKSYSPSKPSGNEIDIGVLSSIGQNYYDGDLQYFVSKYRPDIPKTITLPVKDTLGSSNKPFWGLDVSAETMLDTETVVTQTYPNSVQVYGIGNSFTQGDLFSLAFQQLIADANRPAVFSLSYGSTEAGLTQAQATTMCNNAQKLTSLGTTIVVASGDSGVAGQGSADCTAKFAPTYPSGCPYILSVGATQNFAPEVMVGTDIAGFYSGSGFSNYFDVPSYQKSMVAAYRKKIPSSLNGKYGTGRSFPDVSAQGSKYVIRYGLKDALVGGTSASAPTFAAVVALINDARQKKGKGTVGWAHPTLYKNIDAFHDVKSGGSLGCGSDKSLGFKAGTGFDTPSGLGTPNFAKLRKAFGG